MRVPDGGASEGPENGPDRGGHNVSPERTPWFLNSRLWTQIFIVYAVSMFIGTHWPQLAIPMQGRPDLVVHLSLFGLWTLLLYLSGLFGPRHCWRSVALVHAAGVINAAADESLQAIPLIRRTFGWDDMMFNCFGVLLATLACMWMRARFARSAGPCR